MLAKASLPDNPSICSSVRSRAPLGPDVHRQRAAGRPDRRTEIEADLGHRKSRDHEVQARARLGSLRERQRHRFVNGDKPLEVRPQAQHRRTSELIPRQHIERPQQQMNAVHHLHARLGAARFDGVEVHRIAIA